MKKIILFILIFLNIFLVGGCSDTDNPLVPPSRIPMKSLVKTEKENYNLNEKVTVTFELFKNIAIKENTNISIELVADDCFEIISKNIYNFSYEEYSLLENDMMLEFEIEFNKGSFYLKKLNFDFKYVPYDYINTRSEYKIENHYICYLADELGVFFINDLYRGSDANMNKVDSYIYKSLNRLYENQIINKYEYINRLLIISTDSYTSFYTNNYSNEITYVSKNIHLTINFTNPNIRKYYYSIDSLEVLYIAYECGCLTKEEYEKEVILCKSLPTMDSNYHINLKSIPFSDYFEYFGNSLLIENNYSNIVSTNSELKKQISFEFSGLPFGIEEEA